MMNETAITSMTELTEDEQKFADVLIKIIEGKHKRYERERKELRASPVPLADIKVGPKDFEDVPHIMRGIRPAREPESTVREMLRLLWDKGQLVPHSRDTYMLRKEGFLYKCLRKKLASTQ